MRSHLSTWKTWVLSLVSGLLMLLLTFFWLSLPYTFGDEAFLIKWSSLAKKSLLGFDEKPDPLEVLFVDVSASKTVIDSENQFGESSPYHRKVVTDRVQLAEFLGLVTRYGNRVPLVLCDILFEYPVSGDSILQARFDQLGTRVLGITRLDEQGRHVKPILNFPTALASYSSSDGTFLKYPLVLRDSLKTVPAVLYQRLHGVETVEWAGTYWMDGKLSLTNPIIDFKVRPVDFEPSTELEHPNFTIFKMGTLIETGAMLSEEAMAPYFENRLIIVCDSVNDIHETAFGEMLGSVLIYNAYLTLVEGENLVHPLWICFLLLCYLFLSYRIFSGAPNLLPGWMTKLTKNKVGKFLIESLDELVLLTLVTLFSYFLFNIHVNILALWVYLKVVEWAWNQSPFSRVTPSTPIPENLKTATES